MSNLQKGICREIENGISSKDSFEGEIGGMLILQKVVYQSIDVEESYQNCP